MGTTASPGEYDCWERAEDDEPVFVLLARDPHAARLVSSWAHRRIQAVIEGWRPKSDVAQALEAIDVADAMKRWRAAHRPHSTRENCDRPVNPRRVAAAAEKESEPA